MMRPESVEKRWNIRNGHLVQIQKQNEYGEITKWSCPGCGLETSRKHPEDPCPEPAVWVELGAPGDGLGECEECGTVFAFEYEVWMLDKRCVRCGSIKWHRNDNPAVAPDDVDCSRVEP